MEEECKVGRFTTSSFFSTLLKFVYRNFDFRCRTQTYERHRFHDSNLL